eukprot:Skav222817  [mRNA]  locus=scaffold1444:185244:187561:+ [translate_table: standard]
MLSTSRKKPRMKIEKRIEKRLPSAVSKPQRLLAVARSCRDCGLRLSALEGALHQCSTALDWSFPSETVQLGVQIGTSACRVVRLGAHHLRGAALSRLTELWETIQDTDLAHPFDLPSPERLANQSAYLLMALKGREVLGLLSAERIAVPCPDSLDKMKQKPQTESQQKPQTESQQASQAESLDGAQRAPASPTLGVAVVWVRRRERRRGLATSMVDCLQRLGGCHVAFSQPTELGFAFASSYCRRQHANVEGPLVYDPDWPCESN